LTGEHDSVDLSSAFPYVPFFFPANNQHDSGNFPVDGKSESLVFFIMQLLNFFFPSKRIFALVCLQLVQVRHVSSRERKKNRKPMTPLTSKVKKFKMKAYS
jgi:hypothetical protein